MAEVVFVPSSFDSGVKTFNHLILSCKVLHVSHLGKVLGIAKALKMQLF